MSWTSATRRLSNPAPSCRSPRRRLPTCSRLRRPLESGIMPHSPYLASRDRRTAATSRPRSLRKTSSRRPASPTRLYGLRSLRDAPLLGPDLTGLAAGLMSAPLGQCPRRGITCRGEGNHDVHPCSTGGTGRFRPIPTPPNIGASAIGVQCGGVHTGASPPPVSVACRAAARRRRSCRYWPHRRD